MIGRKFIVSTNVAIYLCLERIACEFQFQKTPIANK